MATPSSQGIKITGTEEREVNLALSDLIGAINDLGSIEMESRHMNPQKDIYIKHARAAETRLTAALKWSDQIRKLSVELEERLLSQRGGKGAIAKEERWAIGIAKSIERGLAANRRRVVELLQLINKSTLKKGINFFGKNDFQKINDFSSKLVRNLRVISAFLRKLKELEMHIMKLEKATFY